MPYSTDLAFFELVEAACELVRKAVAIDFPGGVRRGDLGTYRAMRVLEEAGELIASAELDYPPIIYV